jgi:very-short-patch-repair endonuclease
MPRFLLNRRYWERRADYRAHLGAGVASSFRIGGVVPFIDYWLGIPATLPEKMVFAELIRRQINFKFTVYLGDLKVTPGIYERYRPDFVLIDFNLIIEVAGVYWHSRPGSYEHDAVRAALLEAEGYKVYVVTDTQLLNEGAAATLAKIPEIAGATIHGNTVIVGDRPVDPRAAVRARLRRWPRVNQTHWMDRVRGQPGVAQAWKGAKGPPALRKPVEPVFTTLDQDLKNWSDSLAASASLLERVSALLADYNQMLKGRDTFPRDYIKQITNLLGTILDVLTQLQLLGIYEDWANQLFGEISDLRDNWRKYLG